jgi:Zn-dependent membrane protease YugP
VAFFISALVGVVAITHGGAMLMAIGAAMVSFSVGFSLVGLMIVFDHVVGALHRNDGTVLESDAEGTGDGVEEADLTEYSGLDTLLRLGVVDDPVREGDEVDRDG